MTEPNQLQCGDTATRQRTMALFPAFAFSALAMFCFASAASAQSREVVAPGLQNPTAQAASPDGTPLRTIEDSPSAASTVTAANTLPSEMATQPPAELPDDPSASLIPDPPEAAAPASASPAPETRRAERAASIHMKYIPAGWSAREPLSAHDKVLLGFRDLYSPLTLSGMVLSASYSHLTNGQPNYGVNSEAFGERVGAAVLRDSTEGIFTDAVFAPLLHEDPRYYVEGPQYGFFHRTVYAITRPLITRTDSGRTTINGALLLGYSASSALSYTYYPRINQNFHDTAATFGGGVGGAALGFFVSEFSADLFHKLHLAKQP